MPISNSDKNKSLAKLSIVPTMRLRLKRLARLAFILLILVVYLPPLQILFTKWVNPSTTIPKILWEARNIYNANKVAHPIQWVNLNELPENVEAGIIFSEDDRFYEHFGFDFDEIQLAIREHQETGQKLRGASTITQQCARSLFLWQGRSWFRKALEAYYTIWMEALLTKQRILELYVNVIELGDGVYGLEEGAEAHFNVHAKNLNNDQISKLIAILPNPESWNPNLLPADARRQQVSLLDYLQNHYRLGEPDNLGVIWKANPDFDDRPHNQIIDTIVIHTTEGDTIEGAYDSLLSDNLSVHYIISPEGQIYQLVDVSKRAWHATYYNNRSIGIEMVGYANKASTWNAENLDSLENLVAYLAKKYHIQIIHPLGDACSYPDTWYTEAGIVGHYQIQPSPCYSKTIDGITYDQRSDPGPFFPWATFVDAVRAKVTSDEAISATQRR